MPKKARITVHKDLCIGAGNCAEIAAAYFDQSDADGTVVVLQDEVDAANLEVVGGAVDYCPVSAIELEDAEGDD